MLSTQILQLKVHHLGLIDYNEAYAYQMNCLKECLHSGTQHLIFCEHPSVITLGRMTKKEHLLYPPEEFATRNIDIVKIDRGGDVTLHAPGQLVIYPILNLSKIGKDLHAYIRNLEQIVIDTLGQSSLKAKRGDGQTGVWIDAQKIVSIGIGVKKWIAFHGVGINVNTDLSLFQLIKPCGLNVAMTSMQKELNRVIELKEVEVAFLKTFTQIYPFALKLK